MLPSMTFFKNFDLKYFSSKSSLRTRKNAPYFMNDLHIETKSKPEKSFFLIKKILYSFLVFLD